MGEEQVGAAGRAQLRSADVFLRHARAQQLAPGGFDQIQMHAARRLAVSGGALVPFLTPRTGVRRRFPPNFQPARRLEVRFLGTRSWPAAFSGAVRPACRAAKTRNSVALCRIPSHRRIPERRRTRLRQPAGHLRGPGRRLRGGAGSLWRSPGCPRSIRVAPPAEGGWAWPSLAWGARGG